MKLLLGDGDTAAAAVDVNLTNKSGFTVLDLLDVVRQIVNESGDYILRDLLLRSGALRASELIKSSSAPTPQVHQNSSITEPPRIQNQQNVFVMETSFLNPSQLWKMAVKELEQSSEGSKNALMVVVVLIATVTYQAILQPPGGFDAQDWNITPFQGPALMIKSLALFIPFTILNSVGFFTSVAVIILLINRFPLKKLLRLAVCSMAATYACGFLYIAPAAFIVSLVVPMTMAVVLIADPVGFRTHLAKMMARFRVGSRGISRNETHVEA